MWSIAVEVTQARTRVAILTLVIEHDGLSETFKKVAVGKI
jgi:hypothetical protein